MVLACVIKLDHETSYAVVLACARNMTLKQVILGSWYVSWTLSMKQVVLGSWLVSETRDLCHRT